MKFSASFVVLAFIFSKTALALPVDNDSYDLLERDFSDAYDLEAREFYDNMYEERSFDDDELFERDLFYEDLEARAGGKPAPKPASKPAAKPAAKPAPKPPAKPAPKPPAKPAPKPPAKPAPKPPANQPKKPATQPKKPAGKCKKPTRGGKKRSFVVRTTTGQTITVDGKQYKLGESTSGNGGEETFKVEGGKAFAKRPKRPGNPPADFTQEIANTKKASDALHSGLYIADGTDGGYTWLITGAMPGGEVSTRWFMSPEKFATKKACEDDFKDALAAVKAAQQKLAAAGLVHGDSHPGNWFVPLTGKIDKALPIDFGMTRPGNTNIDALLSQQYKYPADHWAAFAECGICK